jgi:nucleotide-binding universal stress UspA family protein
VLFDQARARGSDLIVIGKHSGRELDERLLGSVTQNILYHAECDVLLGV